MSTFPNALFLSRKACVFVLVCMVVMSFATVPKQTHALGGIGDIVSVVGGTGTLQDTISAAANTVTSGIQQMLQIKEFTLDQIAFSLAKKVLAQTTHSLIDWINGGFDGKPMFITNLNDYLLNAADEVAGEFLQQSNFAFLCKPLQMPVQIVIEQYYMQARDWQTQSSCTLSGAGDNIEDFLSGNFSNGGWTQWFRMVSEPQNNIYGAAAIGISRARNTITSEQENRKTEADWSNGWLSVKDCSTGKCITVTPGNLISEYLNFKLTVGDRTLIEADEINEVMGAFFNQLGNEAMMGIGGLLGMSYSPDGTTPSYLQRFGNEIDQMGSTAGNSSFMDDVIKTETQYRAIHEKGRDDLADVLDTLETCTAPGASSLAKSIASTTKDYDEEIEIATGIIDLLTELAALFDASTDPTERQMIVSAFMDMQRDDFFHTEADLELAKQDIAETVVDFTSRAEQIPSCGT